MIEKLEIPHAKSIESGFTVFRSIEAVFRALAIASEKILASCAFRRKSGTLVQSEVCLFL